MADKLFVMMGVWSFDPVDITDLQGQVSRPALLHDYLTHQPHLTGPPIPKKFRKKPHLFQK